MEKDQFRLMSVDFTDAEARRALNYMIGFASVNPEVNPTDLIEKALRKVGAISE